MENQGIDALTRQYTQDLLDIAHLFYSQPRGSAEDAVSFLRLVDTRRARLNAELDVGRMDELLFGGDNEKEGE